MGCGPRCPGGEAAPAPTTASPPLAGHRGAASLSAPVRLSASAPGPACAQTAGQTRVSRACRRCVSDSRPPEPGRGVGAGDKGAQPRAPAGGSGFAGGDTVSGPGDAVTRLMREPWAPGAARAVPAGAEVLQRLCLRPTVLLGALPALAPEVYGTHTLTALGCVLHSSASVFARVRGREKILTPCWFLLLAQAGRAPRLLPPARTRPGRLLAVPWPRGGRGCRLLTGARFSLIRDF